MQGDAPVSWLMFFTLIAGLAVITGHLGVTANGALPYLLGFGVFALVAMVAAVASSGSLMPR